KMLVRPTGFEPVAFGSGGSRKETTWGGGTPPPRVSNGVPANARQLETTPNCYALSPICHPANATPHDDRRIGRSIQSRNFNERLVSFKGVEDRGPLRFNSAHQLRTTDVSDANPHNRRTAVQDVAYREVLIL